MTSSPETAPLLLVDAAGLWFRAFHALPESLVGPDGQPHNAVRGFCDMLASVVTHVGPAELILCLDRAWRPDWRVALFSGYKAARVGVDGAEVAPESLGPQVDTILALTGALGIATGAAEDMEADDVIGTLAAARVDRSVLVVTGDRDLMQLADARTRVFYIGRGLARAETFGPAEVAERFGLPAPDPTAPSMESSYVDYAVLVGDAADGLPGVAGVGPKTAAGVLADHGGWDAALAAARDDGSDMRAPLRRKLLAGAAYVEAVRPVVRVRRDAPVELVGSPALPAAPPAGGDGLDIARAVGVEGPAGRLAAAVQEAGR